MNEAIHVKYYMFQGMVGVLINDILNDPEEYTKVYNAAQNRGYEILAVFINSK